MAVGQHTTLNVCSDAKPDLSLSTLDMPFTSFYKISHHPPISVTHAAAQLDLDAVPQSTVNHL